MHSVQLFGKPTAIYRFVIQTNSQSSNRYVYSDVKITALILTYVFMFSALPWRHKIYVIFQVERRNVKRRIIATARAVTAFSRNTEGHIRVASSIQEHKTGPFNTTADVTTNSVLISNTLGCNICRGTAKQLGELVQMIMPSRIFYSHKFLGLFPFFHKSDERMCGFFFFCEVKPTSSR